MKTVRFVVDFFSDGRYMLLLDTNTKYRNVRLHEDGRVTICLTDDDIKRLEKFSRLYRDLDGINKDYLFMREKERLFGTRLRRRG